MGPHASPFLSPLCATAMTVQPTADIRVPQQSTPCPLITPSLPPQVAAISPCATCTSRALRNHWQLHGSTWQRPPQRNLIPLSHYGQTRTLNAKQFEALMRQNTNLVATIAKTATTNGGGTANARSGRTGWSCPRANLKECPHCKKMCMHEATDCFSLPMNADKCPVGWQVVRGLTLILI